MRLGQTLRRPSRRWCCSSFSGIPRKLSNTYSCPPTSRVARLSLAVLEPEPAPASIIQYFWSPIRKMRSQTVSTSEGVITGAGEDMKNEVVGRVWSSGKWVARAQNDKTAFLSLESGTLPIGPCDTGSVRADRRRGLFHFFRFRSVRTPWSCSN